MRARWLVATTCAGAFLAACMTPAADRSAATAPIAEPGDLLVLSSPAGLAVADPSTRSVTSIGPAVPALVEPDTLVSAFQRGGRTLVEARDTATSELVGTAEAPSGLAPRVVSADGWRVALMEPPPEGTDPWVPQPRTHTTIVVSYLPGDTAAETYRLRGNFDPEAFSTDGRSLVLLQYVPPEAPAAYRVVLLDLRRGAVEPVYGRVLTKAAPPSKPETMAGTRLSQTASADGSRLYTLYTTEAPGEPHGAAASGNPVAFVHTLDLDREWAHCIALPEAFWGGVPARQAMASSPDGELLYAVDVERDVVTVIDTSKLEAVQTATADFGTPGAGQARAVVSPDGDELFVAAGDRVVRLATSTLRAGAAWTVHGPVSGLGFGSSGSRLYVATANGVEVLDPSTGRRLGRIGTPSPMELVGALDT